MQEENKRHWEKKREKRNKKYIFIVIYVLTFIYLSWTYTHSLILLVSRLPYLISVSVAFASSPGVKFFFIVVYIMKNLYHDKLSWHCFGSVEFKFSRLLLSPLHLTFVIVLHVWRIFWFRIRFSHIDSLAAAIELQCTPFIHNNTSQFTWSQFLSVIKAMSIPKLNYLALMHVVMLWNFQLFRCTSMKMSAYVRIYVS